MLDHAEEMLDLVDTNDNVIGSVARSLANSDPKMFHREIGVIIFDKDNRILLQKRALTKKIGPGLWTVSAAGHVGQGITPLAAAHNELTEELGFDTELEFISKTLDTRDNESRFIYLYKGRFTEGTAIKIDLDEVADAKFVAKNELEDFQKAGNVVGDLAIIQITNYWSK